MPVHNMKFAICAVAGLLATSANASSLSITTMEVTETAGKIIEDQHYTPRGSTLTVDDASALKSALATAGAIIREAHFNAECPKAPVEFSAESSIGLACRTFGSVVQFRLVAPYGDRQDAVTREEGAIGTDPTKVWLNYNGLGKPGLLMLAQVGE